MVFVEHFLISISPFNLGLMPFFRAHLPKRSDELDKNVQLGECYEIAVQQVIFNVLAKKSFCFVVLPRHFHCHVPVPFIHAPAILYHK